MASCERHEPSFVRKSLSALPGILLLTGVAVFSWFITPRLIALHPFMKSLNLSDFIVAIILGMVICNTVGVHAVFRDGLRFSTTLTKTGIVVMGCKYSFAGLIKTGSEAIIIISVFLFTSAIILMWLSRRLSMSPSLGACLAAGLSICGVSACVAIAPAVRAKNEDIAYTIAVVLMFGLLALFIFPFIGHWLDLSPNQFGAFAGVGIVNSAQVLAAGFAFNKFAALLAAICARIGSRKAKSKAGEIPPFFVSPVVVWGMAESAGEGAGANPFSGSGHSGTAAAYAALPVLGWPAGVLHACRS